MRLIVVGHVLGILLFLLGGLMLVPLGVSLLLQESDWPALLASSLITISVGGSLWFWTRKQPGLMQRKESFVVVAMAWLLASAFGALPYMLAGTFTSFIDAYFEAMSGFTATGASVLADIEAQPQGILFWRSFTQWIGGLGIIALFLGIVPLVRVGGGGATALYEDEASGPQADRVTPRIQETARAAFRTYVAFTLLGVILLVLAGMSIFDAASHIFSAIATGGFSPKNASIAYYKNPAVHWIITVFMVLGGINFGLYYFFWKAKFRQLWQNTELKIYLAMVVAGSMLVTTDLLLQARDTSLYDILTRGTFQYISLQTGTGLVIADYDQWPGFSKTLMLFAMFVGASAGSTCGALKVVRLVVLAKYAHRQIYSVFHPRVISPLKLNGRALPDHIVRETVAYFIVYEAVFLASTLAVSAMGLDFSAAITGSLATLATVGPGFGQVGPLFNYAWIPDLAKVIFTFNMFVGRLEFWTVLILLRTAFWKEP
ncbi:MAG: TrkH family potassium uptake protein [Chloroflexota bacterium]|jgi:trk system potassium uptake protein TrkH